MATMPIKARQCSTNRNNHRTGLRRRGGLLSGCIHSSSSSLFGAAAACCRRVVPPRRPLRSPAARLPANLGRRVAPKVGLVRTAGNSETGNHRTQPKDADRGHTGCPFARAAAGLPDRAFPPPASLPPAESGFRRSASCLSSTWARRAGSHGQLPQDACSFTVTYPVQETQERIGTPNVAGADVVVAAAGRVALRMDRAGRAGLGRAAARNCGRSRRPPMRVLQAAADDRPGLRR